MYLAVVNLSSDVNVLYQNNIWVITCTQVYTHGICRQLIRVFFLQAFDILFVIDARIVGSYPSCWLIAS